MWGTNNLIKKDTLQSVKKVVSDSSGLVDFAIRLVNPLLNLSEGQVKFFGKFKLQKNYNQGCSSKKFWGHLKDSWASTDQQQLARTASHKTSFFAPSFFLQNVTQNVSYWLWTSLFHKCCIITWLTRNAGTLFWQNLYALTSYWKWTIPDS